MTQGDHVDRWGEIDRSLDGALSHADHEVGAVMRETLNELRSRLRRVHRDPERISGPVWATYVADLDRGLAELESEVHRAREHPAEGPAVEDVLYARRTRFEVEGWALHYAALAPDGPPSDLVPACHSELASFRAACATGRPAARDGVEAAVGRLRTAIEEADPGRARG